MSEQHPKSDQHPNEMIQMIQMNNQHPHPAEESSPSRLNRRGFLTAGAGPKRDSIRKGFNMNMYRLGLSLAASLFIATAAAPAMAQTPAKQNTHSMQDVTFNYNTIKMAGNLYLPADFDRNKQ